MVNLGAYGPIDGADTRATVRGRQAQDYRCVNPGMRVLRELAAG
jgi:hypothetical protein